MRECLLALAGCGIFAGALVGSSHLAPKLVYGSYLGGQHKECATAIAADAQGHAYLAGRTPSGDFPVTAGAFRTNTRVNNNDWTGFVSKFNESGSQLVYSTFLGGSFDSSINALTADKAGRAYVVGSTCSRDFPTTAAAILPRAPGSDKTDVCDAFLAQLDPQGSQLEYSTYLGGPRSDAATAVALNSTETVVYVAGYTSSEGFPTTGAAPQNILRGATNGFLVALDTRSGKLLYGTYLGGDREDRVSSIAVAANGFVYLGGTTNSQNWPDVRLTRYGRGGSLDGFVVRADPSGHAPPVGIRLGGSGENGVAALAVDSLGDVYAVGTTNSTDFPVHGANLRAVGSGFVVKLSGAHFGEPHHAILWSRRLGGHGEDALLAASAAMPGALFVSGRSGSDDFPTTAGAFYRKLEAQNDSILARLRGSDGRLEYATFIGGTQQQGASWYNDEATGVVATPQGDVYLSGCTLDDRLPVSSHAFQPRRKGNADAFALRLKFPY